MKVLVTGAAGFIGMHVVQRLVARGDSVVGVDKIAAHLAPGAAFIDVKAAFPQAELEARGLRVWRL